MTITSQDVKIFQSQVIADSPDGGGRMTGNLVVDGALNNLFDDTSRLDRVVGRVSLRKGFGAVTTATTDKFLGAHAIITRPPMDGRVAATLLDLEDHADTREAARAFLEKYLIAGVETQLTLYSNHPADSRFLQVYQEPADAPPLVGDVYFLSVEKVGDANFGRLQAVRVLSLMRATVSATDGGGVFSKTVYTLELSEALEVSYTGSDLLRSPQPSSRATKVRRAELNPVAQFYGVTPLAEAIEADDTLIKVESILNPVVPASYAEKPLLDQQLGANTQTAVAAGPAYAQSFTVTASGNGLSVQLLRPAQPGSVSVVAEAAGGDNDASFTDAGGGVLTRSGGGPNTTTASGTAVYGAGQISLSGLANVAYTVTVSYVPVAAVSTVQHTDSLTITLANRGFNYARTLVPKPAPGTLIVAYRTLGNWYTLADNGKGGMVGAPGTGAGTINYLTGTANITLGYQPDVGSELLYGWGTGAHYTQALAALDADMGSVNGSLSADAGLLPGSLSIAYSVGATNYTVTDNGAGRLQGDGEGSVNYATGRLVLRPAQQVASGAQFVLSAQKKAFRHESPTATVSGGNASFSLANPPARANTVRVRAIYSTASSGNQLVEFVDDGSGSFRQLTGQGATGKGVLGAGTLRGNINLTSGAASLPATITNGYRRYVYGYGAGAWSGATETLTFVSIEALDYTDDAASTTAANTSFNQASLSIDFARAAIAGFVPGSLLFSLAGRTYFDAAGKLYYQSGGSDVEAGTFDYLTGLGTITSWVAGSRSVSIHALLAKYGQWLMDKVVWRTDAAPLRSQSFQVTDGVQVATASSQDAITSPWANGSIDLDLGVYRLTFTPPVVPELLRYNAVALSYLPTDPDILGLNAVRLPLDGRVPIVADGQVLVILNDQVVSLPNPVVAGQTYSLGRDRLAYAVLLDADGNKVPTNRYTTNLDTGHITMANPLDLNGYPQPLKVEHRIEDMVQCLDAQLSGDVQISGAITHDYPVPGSYVASAKLYGDLQAQAGSFFSQQSWTGVWSDSPIGSATSGQYNLVAYPLVVTNAGAIRERWRIEFTSVIAFRLIGETVGQIAQGDINTDFAPVNPATGAPYFSINKQGWGSGWLAGNQVRFNTLACSAPLWLVRCTLQGPAEEPNDDFRIQFRGDN